MAKLNLHGRCLTNHFNNGWISGFVTLSSYTYLRKHYTGKKEVYELPAYIQYVLKKQAIKRTLLIFSFFTATTIGFAQKNQQQKNDSVCQLIKKYWTEKNADKIYDMAGVEFKQQLSLPDFRTVCTQNLFPMGNIKTTFESFENGTSKYKAVFSSDSLSFYLNLDNKNKLGTFSFTAYQK